MVLERDLMLLSSSIEPDVNLDVEKGLVFMMKLEELLKDLEKDPFFLIDMLI
jgi:hypothetical protein